MNKTENYLGIAKHDILMANNSEELKSYVASVLCEIDELQQENNKLKMINKEYERLNKEKHRGFKITDVQEYDIYELLSYKKYKDNWNELKEYIVNDINDRNGTKIVEFEEGNRVSETISPTYTLMEDKSRSMREVLDKMQELEQGSDKE